MTDKFADQEIIKAFEDTINTISKRDCLIVPKDGIENLCFGLKSVLDLINRQQEEIERFNVELVGMRGACNSYKMHYDNAQTEIEEARIGVKSYKNKYESAVRTAKEYQSVIKEKDEEIERLKEDNEYLNDCVDTVYNLVKETMGDK